MGKNLAKILAHQPDALMPRCKTEASAAGTPAQNTSKIRAREREASRTGGQTKLDRLGHTIAAAGDVNQL